MPVTQESTVRTNWAGNITYRAARLHRPRSMGELQEIVSRASRLRPLGTGHSFNRLADTDGDLVSVADLPRVLEIDARRRTVTVSAGLRYGEVTGPLHASGWALANLGSLPHISVAGAVATGTHGSGEHHGSLATAVRAQQMVVPGGELVTLDRDDDGDVFDGAVVALGALGVVTRLTLDIVPAFQVRQLVYDDLDYDRLVDAFDEIVAAAYSVSVFIDWRGPVRGQIWLKQRIDDPERAAGEAPQHWLGASLADGPRHPIPGMSPVHCTPQLGEPGPWHERLPHFRLGFTPSSGEELQSEFLVGRGFAIDALRAIAAMHEHVAPVLLTSEVRTVAADGLWLSPAYHRDSVALHFTWIADAAAVAPVVAALEQALAPFDPRPHWGKVFSIPPHAVTEQYERWAEFTALSQRFDPDGVLRNDLLLEFLGRST
jgi:xylitol oxidase